jgi:hypothetical protein
MNNDPIVINDTKFTKIYNKEVQKQKAFKQEFDKALTGVDPNDKDAVFDALFSYFK